MVLKPICALLPAALLLAFAAKAETYKWDAVAMGHGIYMRTDASGAYRWDMQRERWIPLQDWLPEERTSLMGVESVAVDPKNAANVYLMAGTDYANGSKSAILRSRDYGQTFKITGTTPQFTVHGNATTPFAINPTPLSRPISITSPAVPEPGSLALITLGVTAPGWPRRRRKRPV
ncbi:PEP-CTERM sorting domain-containing protein [Pseudoduganella sp. UC29_106]|uniref:PEP-CTERM sorting domain-containing protein n=1 Tax=Pseudoduganella sp. UC29_106 TaxID=3374553 RepID=UPI003757A264